MNRSVVDVTLKCIARPRAALLRAGRAWPLLAIISLMVAIGTSGCSSSSSNTNETSMGGGQQMSAEQCANNGQLMRASAPDGSYVIQPGDQLSINFYLNSEFNQEVSVRPDGKIAMQLIGAQQAAGETPQQLAKELDQAYSGELRSPGATVMVKNMPSREVFVQGQVSKPGGFELQPGMTVMQSIAQAGGLTDQAGETAVLVRRDACGVPTMTNISIKAAQSGTGSGEEDAFLQSRDMVVVPRSGIANADLWVSQYIRNLLPVQPYVGATPTF